MPDNAVAPATNAEAIKLVLTDARRLRLSLTIATACNNSFLLTDIFFANQDN